MPSILHDDHLSIDTWQYIAITVGDLLSLLEVVAWLMVALGVLRARGRQPAPPVGAPGPFSPPPGPPPGPAGRV